MMTASQKTSEETRWHEYTREHWWKTFGKPQGTKPLNRADINMLKRMAGTNETLDAAEIRRIYAPLVNLIIKQLQPAHLEGDEVFILGISGSVAVGKSTGARLITELLRREISDVALVTTDNFLKPNSVLEQESILRRKGFPESYDQKVISQFLSDLTTKQASFTIPTYDHIAYTIIEQQTIQRPKILVLEGVNVLQGCFPLDYKLYFHSDHEVIKQWYVNRFLQFRQNAFKVPGAYFERFAKLSDTEAVTVASDLWDTINLVNLQEHIYPSRLEADCILSKDPQHRINGLQLKQS